MNAPLRHPLRPDARSVSEALSDLILNLEPKVRNIVSWGDAFASLGTAGTCPQPEAIYVMGMALLDVATELSAGWDQAFALSRPPVAPASSTTPSSDLLSLVEQYEAASNAMHDDFVRCERIGLWPTSPRTTRLVTDAGLLRAQIALWPASSWPDLLLKVRAYAYRLEIEEERQGIRATIADQKGHGYMGDLASGIATDLLRLRDEPPS